MKKLMILALGAVAMVACKQQGPKAEDLMMTQQADSLNRIIQQKDNEINDMMATFNEIEEGFRTINAAQDRVTLAKAGEGSNRVERMPQRIERCSITYKEIVGKCSGRLMVEIDKELLPLVAYAVSRLTVLGAGGCQHFMLESHGH